MKQFYVLLILLSASLSLQAQSALLTQKIDFEAKDLLLKDALIQLSHQTQIAFSAPSALLPSKKITLRIKDQSIQYILQKLLKGTSIVFKRVDQEILFYKKKTAKRHFTISGYIKEKDSGERMPFATVYEEKAGKGLHSNEYGFYSLSLPRGMVSLQFSYTGCKTIHKKIDLKRDMQLNIDLDASIFLQEVLVTSKEISNALSINTTPSILAIQQLQLVPSVGGEPDLIRGLSALPGVTTGPDGFGGIQIRGGSVDQNLFLLDGVPIYNPLHTGGLYSVFDERIIKSAQLYKGDAPARYGGKLSAVLDVQMKEGNQNKVAGQIDIGLTTAKASIEGPIKKGHSSFIIALRKSIFHTYLQPISRNLKERKGDLGQTAQDFTDFNSKINFSLGKRDQLYFSIYQGGDNFQDQNRSETGLINFSSVEHNQDLNWGNTIMALRWNHLFSDQLFANTTITSSKFHFQSKEFYQETITNSDQGETTTNKENLFYSLYNSSITDQTAKIDFNYLPNMSHAIRFGIAATEYTFKPGAFTLNQNSVIPIRAINHPDSITSYSNTVVAQEYAAYIEDNIRFGDKLKINFGVRSALLAVQEMRYWSIQPRLSSRIKISDQLIIHASFSKNNQNHHLLTNSGVSLPSDLWVPATAKVKPQEAWQTNVGLTRLINKTLSLDIVAYQKNIKNLIAYQEGSSFLVESIVLNASDWESKVAFGTGKSYGVEISLTKQIGRLQGWMSYTWSKSLRHFDALNFGETYNFKFDRPHSFKLTGIYQLTNRMALSANWSYQTGLPTTLPTSEYTFYSSNLFAPTTVFNIGDKNSFRLPDYHRLDIELTMSFGKKDQQVLKIGLYNAYNRSNPLFYRLKDKKDGSGEKEFVQVSLLPILPSLNYSLSF